jgi:lipopolysaccharide export system permease protein
MRLLDRYLLREMAPTVLGAALTFVVLLVGHMLYTVVEVVVERGVPLPSVMHFLALKVPEAAVMALPVSMLLGSALAFNRLQADGELTAVRAAGTSFLRMMAPAAMMGVAVAIVVLVLNEEVAPRCEEASRRLLMEAVSEQRALAFQARRFLQLSDTAFVYPEEVDPKRERLVNVKLFMLRGDSPPVLVEAPEAVFVGGELVAPRARPYVPEWSGDVAWGSVGTVKVALKSEGLYLPGGAGELRGSSLGELWRHWQEDKVRYPQQAARWSLEFNSRLAMAVAALVMALLAGPLTVAVGKGHSLSGVALSLGVVFLYYLGMLWLRLAGDRGVLPPVAAAWGENGALLVLTGWLIYRLR